MYIYKEIIMIDHYTALLLYIKYKKPNKTKKNYNIATQSIHITHVVAERKMYTAHVYQSQHSRQTSLVMGLENIEVFVFIMAERTSPSLLTLTSVTRPRGHTPLGVFS